MFSKPILSRGQSSFPATLSLSLYHILTRTGYGLRKHRWHFPSRSQVRNDNEFSISWHRRNKRGHSSNSKYIPLPELSYRVYVSGFIQRWRCQNGKLWKQHSTSNLFVLFSFLFLSFTLAILYYLDHLPRIIGNEKVVHSQSHVVSNGTCHVGT